MKLSFVVNDEPVVVHTAPGKRLVDVLRDELGLLGTKEGCGNGECGACTVLIGERAVVSCLVPAAEVEGASVTTIEGLSGPDGQLSPLQRAFIDNGGVQCGFCTPGMILSAHALLRKKPKPSAEEIRDALVGNLCRCTGYAQIVESIQAAANAPPPAAPAKGGEHG